MEDDRKISATFAGTHHHDDSSDDEDGGDQLNRSKGPLRKRKYSPSPPKRFKSSYICFSMAMQDTVKAEMGGDHKIGQVSKYMAEKWRNLDDEERAKWDEVARKDRERYEAEMALFPGPKPKPKPRPKKDPTAPKRPMSAFLAFSQKYRGTVRKNDPTVHNRDVSKKLSEMWKELPEEEKKEFIEQESKEREVYKAKMVEWKKEQAEVQERMKEERKADSKRRRLEKAKERRKNEREMAKQLRAAEAEFYVDQAKESGDPSQLRKLSAMGCLAAAAEVASKVDGSPTSEPTAENAAVGAGAVTTNPSGHAGHEPGHFAIAAAPIAAAVGPVATADQVMSAHVGLAAGSSHGGSGAVEGYSMEGEVQRALTAAGATQAIPTSTSSVQHHHTSPAAALLRAYSRPGAQTGGSVMPAATSIAAVASRASQLVPSAQMHPQVNVSSSTASRDYLQQLLVQEDFVREQLAHVRAQEAAALAQMRARIQERTRMRLEAERERVLLSLRQHRGHPGLPGGDLIDLHGSLAFPSTTVSYLDPGLSRSRAAYLSAATQGLGAAPSQTLHDETLTGNMLLELMEARRREAALAALAFESRAAAAGGVLAPQVGMQPTQPMLLTGAIPLEVPSASLPSAGAAQESLGATQAPSATLPSAGAAQAPLAAPPPVAATQDAPATEETSATFHIEAGN